MSATFAADPGARRAGAAAFDRPVPRRHLTVEGGVNVVTKPPRQNPGRPRGHRHHRRRRGARFLLPTASLQNTAGAFVGADDRHRCRPASRTPRSTPTGSRRSRRPDLQGPAGSTRSTLLLSAALSTQADQGRRATEMADLLDYVAGPGQVPGDELGQLPDGHAPLTDARRPGEGRAAAVVAGERRPDRRAERRPTGRARPARRHRRSSRSRCGPAPTVPVDVPAPDDGAEPTRRRREPSKKPKPSATPTSTTPSRPRRRWSWWPPADRTPAVGAARAARARPVRAAGRPAAPVARPERTGPAWLRR